MKAIGIGISAPLAFKMSQLAVAQSSTRPNRLFIYFLPHGAPMEHWEVGDGMDLGASGRGILTPLDAYKNNLTVLRNVGMGGGATNHAAISSVLTGAVAGGSGKSIDCLIAEQIGAVPHALGVMNLYPGADQLSSDGQLINHGGWVTPIQNPYDALEDLFQGIGTGPAPVPGAVDEATFRAEAIDLNISEVEAMQGELASLTLEKNKLQIHLDALRALKETAGGGGGILSCDKRPALPSAEAMQGKDARSVENFATTLDGHLEAAAYAFSCGTAKVITLQNMYVNGQILMNFAGGPGYTKNHHDPISHSSDAAGRAEFAEVVKWFYTRLSEKFLSVLAATPDPQDPEHTVLDNTTVLTCTEICDGSNHNSKPEDIWVTGSAMPTYLPWTLIGGGGGFFKTGQVVNFNNFLDHRNVLAALAESMGAPLTSIGGASVSTPAELKA